MWFSSVYHSLGRTSTAAYYWSYYTIYRTLEVAENFGRYLSCIAYILGERLWIVLTVKMETRHPVGGSVGSEFSATVIIAELWQPEIARPGNFVSNFCVFLEKRPLMVNFQNTVPNVYMTTPIDVVVFECHKICLRGNRWNRALFTSQKKIIGCLSNCWYWADRAQNLPEPVPTILFTFSRFHPNRFSFGGITAERVKAAVCPTEYFHDRLFELLNIVIYRSR